MMICIFRESLHEFADSVHPNRKKEKKIGVRGLTVFSENTQLHWTASFACHSPTWATL